MSNNKKSIFLVFGRMIGINGLLLAPFLFGVVYCTIQFTEMWNSRHKYTKEKVFERNTKEEEEREARTLQEEEQEVDNDKEYQTADFRVPPELIEKSQKAFAEYKNKETE